MTSEPRTPDFTRRTKAPKTPRPIATGPVYGYVDIPKDARFRRLRRWWHLLVDVREVRP